MGRGGPPSERALQIHSYPLFRLGGSTALALSAILHNVVAGRASLGNVLAIVGSLAAWPLLSWLALARWYGRTSRVDLGIVVAFGDIVVWTLAIYLTGADGSLLFFLMLLRAADLRTENFRLVLLFGHFSIACYVLLLVYVALLERPIDWPAEAVKVMLLYLANVYRALTAKAAEAVEAARNRARAAKTSFVANVSHEMRTPLNGVIGGTRLLESTELSAAQRHHVAMIRSSAETLLQLIDEILDVSKLEASKLTIEPITFALRATLAEALRPPTPAADIKGLLLKIRVADEVPDTLVGDPVRLRQIVVNLVSNAIKFTDDGEIEVRLTLEPGDGDDIV